MRYASVLDGVPVGSVVGITKVEATLQDRTGVVLLVLETCVVLQLLLGWFDHPEFEAIKLGLAQVWVTVL
jgi:ABC-type sugar transport system permease subunit